VIEARHTSQSMAPSVRILLTFSLSRGFFGHENGDDMFFRNFGIYKTTRRHVPEDDLFIVTVVETSNPTLGKLL
jgi:hypothetical protein